MIVGLTGGIGSGKSAVSDYLAKLGYPIVDTDLLAREVVEPGSVGLAAIAEHFGKNVINQDGQLDRAALRERVFKDSTEKAWLEELLHPMIRTLMLAELHKHEPNAPFVVLSSPLLLETDQHTLVDTIVVVDLPESLQIERASQRDKNSVDQIKRIMASQVSRQKRLASANTVLDNSGTLENLYQQIDQFCETIR
jgi:dephospho-CoA kinase